MAIALQMAAAGSVSGVEEGSLRALVKLEQVMPVRLRTRIDALRTAILPIDRTGPAVPASTLSTLATACRDQLRVDFDYLDGKGQPSHRSVEPQGMVHTGYRWYLVAWDPARDDWRTFRIDRLVGVPSNGAHFLPRPGPDGGDLRAYVVRSISAPPAERAQVLLHAPHHVLVQRLPPVMGTLSPVGDSASLLSCGAVDQGVLVYWLMTFDVEFEVLEPPSLRTHLQAVGDRFARSALRRDSGASATIDA